MNHSLINGCRNTFLKVRFLTIKSISISTKDFLKNIIIINFFHVFYEINVLASKFLNILKNIRNIRIINFFYVFYEFIIRGYKHEK